MAWGALSSWGSVWQRRLSPALAQAKVPLPQPQWGPSRLLACGHQGAVSPSFRGCWRPQYQVHISQIRTPRSVASCPSPCSSPLASLPQPSCTSLSLLQPSLGSLILRDWACCHCLSGRPPVWSGAAPAPPLSPWAGLGCSASGLPQYHRAQQGFWPEKDLNLEPLPPLLYG